MKETKMSIILYDTNNWARIKLEKDYTGLGVRFLWSEATQQDGNVRIFVFEGYKGNEKRRSLYPDYKKTRVSATDSFFDNLKFFRKLLAYAPKTVGCVSVDGYEADDVLNTIAKDLGKVSIMTTDRDLTQIEKADFPMIKNELTEREFVRTYKTLVGDSSDNIKGVQGFGKGSWEKAKPFWKELRSWCSRESDLIPESLSNRERNALLKADRNQVDIYWNITGLIDIKEKIEISWGNGNTKEAEKEMEEYLI